MLSFIKKGWLGLAALAFIVTLSAVQSFSAPTAPISPDCTCNAPGNAAVTSQTSTTVSFSWSPAFGAAAYEVWYVRTNDGYTSSTTTVSGTSISYSGLAAGNYKFYFRTNCGEGVSEIVVLEDILMG